MSTKLINTLKTSVTANVPRKNAIPFLEYDYNVFINNYNMIVLNKAFKTKTKNLKKIQRKSQSGVYTTNCLNCCDSKCHMPCGIKDNAAKDFAMVCKLNCDWACHSNLGYYYEEIEEEVKTVLENTKKNYEKGVCDAQVIDTNSKNIVNSIKLLTADIIDCINKSTFSLNKLDRIALRIKADPQG